METVVGIVLMIGMISLFISHITKTDKEEEDYDGLEGLCNSKCEARVEDYLNNRALGAIRKNIGYYDDPRILTRVLIDNNVDYKNMPGIGAKSITDIEHMILKYNK